MSPLAQLALAPLGFAYGALMRARAGLYRRGVLAVQEIGAPVVSVGNITAGGTGKTPLVELLARAAAGREGLRACVLTRGYGRADERRRVVVSDGVRLLAGAREAGDEPRLLAESLLPSGVAVVSDADRAGAARFALESFGSQIFILDDGFQHLRVARDLNVATLDATDPFGGGRILPAGCLREPRTELRRADCVVITRAELAADLDALRADAARLSGGPVFTARTRTRGVKPLLERIRDENGEEVGAAADVDGATIDERLADPNSPPRSVLAFCAVGNPRAFFAHARGEGFELSASRAFADHHDYTQADADNIAREARRAGARGLLTTAKDAVKLRALRFDVPCYVLEIGLEIDEEERLLGLMRAAIERGAARVRGRTSVV